ncbi:MAG: GAF domain-containing protein, partial [Deltaproteobacteria bacterium]|nr:GAF domain-containing protein [Deltaproteobacteria bacterium]
LPEVVKNFKGSIGQGVTGHVVATGEAIIVNDVSEWNGYIEGVAGARAEMAAPLRIEDQIIGVLDAESKNTGAFVEGDLELFRVFANQAATAIKNASLMNQLERRSEQLEKTVNELALLNRLGQQMNSNLSIDSLLEEVLQLAKQALRFDHCAVLLKEDVNDEVFLVVRAAIGYREEVAKGMRIRAGEGITGRVLKSGKAVLVPDVKMNGGYIEGVAGGRCEMAVPLIVKDEVIGVLDAEATEPGAFSEKDMRLFSTFVSWAAVALHNAEIYSQLEKKKAQLARNVDEINSMNKELKEYAARIEKANLDLEKRVKELVTLQEASQAITSSLNLSDTLDAIVTMTREIVVTSSCAIRLLDEETEEKLSLDQAAPGKPVGSDPKSGTGELKSFLGLPLKIGDRIIGYFELGSLDEEAFGDSDRRVLQVLASQAAIAIENARLFENTQETYYETIRSLAQALEARDAYTKGHSDRVTKYSLGIAKQMKLSRHSVRVIQYAGLLHDIGKIGISDTILHKKLRLTDDEWDVIRNHPLFGDSILGPLKFLNDAQEIVLRHHERYDGSGYPGQLVGEEIPLEARIIAVADAYDAMTSDRPYRKAMESQLAISEIKQASGIQFDSAVVEAFVAIVDKVRNEILDIAK